MKTCAVPNKILNNGTPGPHDVEDAILVASTARALPVHRLDQTDEGFHHFAQQRHVFVSGRPRSQVIYRKSRQNVIYNDNNPPKINIDISRLFGYYRANPKGECPSSRS